MADQNNPSDDEKPSARMENNGTEGGSSNDESSSTTRHKKSKKKKSHRKKRGRDRDRKREDHDHDEDEDSSTDSEDDDESSRRGHRRKHKKQKKKHKKKHKKRRKDTDDSSRCTSEKEGKGQEDSQPSFGKYGILKREDFPRMQRALEVWLDEVKRIAASVLSRRDLQHYFDEFREDYNTATMPHAKYYNFDAWEQAEWHKQQQQQQNRSSSHNAKSDEQAHKAFKRQTEEASVKLDAQTIADMKHQETLRTQMQVAFRMGDTEKYERLRRRLKEDT